MRVLVPKPDFGVTGGFERVLERVKDHLRGQGHDVVDRRVDATRPSRAPFGLEVPPHVWNQTPEYFRYIALVEAFGRVDASGSDVVLATQPPSFAVTHDRVISLFYHHARMYYELEELYISAGFADASRHHAAAAALRSVDAPHLARVERFLAGSAEVASRLAEFNQRTTGVDLFLAGADIEPVATTGPAGRGPALCVSRSEWPKRTELFVQASHLLPGHPAVLVGEGGRLPFVRELDAALAEAGPRAEAFTNADLWLNRGLATGQPTSRLRRFRRRGSTPSAHLEMTGRVDDRRLDQLYRGAGCVVAPAYREDYGLTVLEAHARARPVIVCRDGGGLVDLVEHGVTGFIVEPTGRAIADAITELREDPTRATAMGAAGRDRLAEFSWDRALAVVDEAVAGT